MPKLAKNVIIDMDAGKVTVDGQEFPYPIARESIVTDADPDGMTSDLANGKDLR